MHHVDGNGHNNHPSNLVVCENQSYHWILHRRQRAYDATGDANANYCEVCLKYDRQDELRSSSRSASAKYPRTVYYHLDCARRRQYERKTEMDIKQQNLGNA